MMCHALPYALPYALLYMCDARQALRRLLAAILRMMRDMICQ